MAGAIIIVVVLLLIPVLVLMSGGDRVGDPRRSPWRWTPRRATRAASCSTSPTEPIACTGATTSIAELTEAIVRYAVERVRLDPPPLDGPRTPAELRAAAGPTITPGGIGGLEALRIFAEVLAPACISVDHPRFLSFVPAAPTEASILFDLVVGASSIYGGSWLEGGGAVFAENEALRWIADLAGLPAGAGGVFVSGGTAGNLSALIAARWRWRRPRRRRPRPHAWPDRSRPAARTRRSPRRRGRWTPTSSPCRPTTPAG